jgi:hypothetical protein
VSKKPVANLLTAIVKENVLSKEERNAIRNFAQILEKKKTGVTSAFELKGNELSVNLKTYEFACNKESGCKTKPLAGLNLNFTIKSKKIRNVLQSMLESLNNPKNKIAPTKIANAILELITKGLSHGISFTGVEGV